jgi:hypothetical protein
VKKKKKKKKRSEKYKKKVASIQTKKPQRKSNLIYKHVQEYSAQPTSGKLTLHTVWCVSQSAPSLRIATEGNWNV